MANNDPTYAPAGVGGVQGVSTEAASMLQGFWPDTMNDIRRLRSVSQIWHLRDIN